jgi:hypothetical protein
MRWSPSRALAARRNCAPGRGRGGDFPRFLRIAAYDLSLERVGRASDGFLSYGAYGHGPGGASLARRLARRRPGHRRGADQRGCQPCLVATAPAASGGKGETRPHRRCRQGRRLHLVQGAALRRPVVETGALARQMVAGHPLAARDLVGAMAAASLARVVARLLELASVVPAMERWVRALTPGEPFCTPVAATRVRPVPSASSKPRAAPRPLAAHRARPHRALPDHRPDHLELLAARRGRPARGAGTGAGRPAGGRRRAARPSSTSCARSIRAWCARCIDEFVRNVYGMDQAAPHCSDIACATPRYVLLRSFHRFFPGGILCTLASRPSTMFVGNSFGRPFSQRQVALVSP